MDVEARILDLETRIGGDDVASQHIACVEYTAGAIDIVALRALL